ncbi:MAG: hypothetical protein ACPGR5_03000, partial [Chitinophagales bacterium]
MLKKYFFSLLILIFFVNDVNATHFLGSEITYECIGSNIYTVSATIYRDCGINNAPLPNSLNLNYASSCGSGNVNLTRMSLVDITPSCPTEPSCSGTAGGVEEHVYQETLDLNPFQCSDWILTAGPSVSNNLCCRNTTINTLDNPGSNTMYISSSLDNTNNAGCNSSPQFNNAPSSTTCINQPFVYNHGVSDADGDSLYFSLGPCYQTATSLVTYAAGFNGATPLNTTSGVNIDNATGALFFTPTTQQIAIICIVVEEFRNGIKIGEVNRDMQFNILNCNNVSPTASGVNGTPGNVITNYQTNVCAVSPFCFTVDGTDPDGDIVNMSWNAEISNATFNVTNNNTISPQGQFCWTPTDADLGNNIFTVNVVDDNCPVVGSSTFTYVIEVEPSPNSLTLSSDTGVCNGESVVLTATTNPAASSITWSPAAGLSSTNGSTVTASPSVTTTYTVLATFPDGCDLQENVTVSILAPPTANVTPANSFACSGGNITLTANTNSTGYTFAWFNPSNTALGSGTVAGNSSNINVSLPASSGIYNYYVRITNPSTGCFSTDTAVVNIAAPTGNVCNVLYVSTTGNAANAGTQAAPLSLAEGLIQGACNGTVLKMAIGTYNINNALNIPSHITLEGGFDPGNGWAKTSLAGATTINRTTANPEGAVNARRLVAFYGNNSDGFRFQDITIQTANANQDGMSTYGLHLTSCSNYDIVRTQVLAGDA